MEPEERPILGCANNAVLKINSEEDLLVLDETTGVKKYIPITQDDVTCFKREAEHLYNEIQYVINDFRWNEGKQKSLTHYYHIYQNLAEQLTDFLKFIHSLHKKVYITIYKSYTDEIKEIYTQLLEKVLHDIQAIARKHADYFLDKVEYGQIPFALDIFKKCKEQKTPAGTGFSEFQPRSENSISSGLKMALGNIISTVHEISDVFSALTRTRSLRTDHEAVIIYHYIKREFDKEFLPGYLKHAEKMQKRHMESRKMDFTKANLQQLMVEIVGKYCNHNLFETWYDNITEEDEEVLVCAFAGLGALRDDFVKLFQYQGEYMMLEKEIAAADEFERHSDPFFKNWIDSYRLENLLEFWIKGNITKQKHWFIVWCLMKHTFHMVRDNQDKNAFAARMNQMFPDVEKKCVVESFRKQETQLNHNRPFDEWLENSDPDYNIAKSLYEKLKKTDEYKRSI